MEPAFLPPQMENLPHREAWPHFFSPPKYCSMNHEHSGSQLYGVEGWEGEQEGRDSTIVMKKHKGESVMGMVWVHLSPTG